MFATLICSFGFLIVKYFEYSAKFDHHLYPWTDNFLGTYFKKLEEYKNYPNE